MLLVGGLYSAVSVLVEGLVSGRVVVGSDFLIDEDVVLLLFVLGESPLAGHVVVACVGSVEYPLLRLL